MNKHSVTDTVSNPNSLNICNTDELPVKLQVRNSLLLASATVGIWEIWEIVARIICRGLSGLLTGLAGRVITSGYDLKRRVVHFFQPKQRTPETLNSAIPKNVYSGDSYTNSGLSGKPSKNPTLMLRSIGAALRAIPRYSGHPCPLCVLPNRQSQHQIPHPSKRWLLSGFAA